MNINQMDLITENVVRDGQFLLDLLELRADDMDENYVQISVNDLVLMLSPSAMVLMEKAASVILQDEVADSRGMKLRTERLGGKFCRTL